MTPEEEANVIADAAVAALVKQGVKAVSKNGRVELAPLDAMLVAGRLRDAS